MTQKISELELKSAVEKLIEKLEAGGAHVYIPRKDLDYAAREEGINPPLRRA